jgi:D-amino-acid dehydrogenase
MKTDSKHILIVGAGVIGLCTAYYCARRGHRVTVIDRNPEERDGCSFGNAGMVTPSHFVPLAAPGMVKLGLKWMWNPESPFYVKPRLDRDLISWGWKFMRAANAGHVERSAPLLRDLCFASRACFEEMAEEWSVAAGVAPAVEPVVPTGGTGVSHSSAPGNSGPVPGGGTPPSTAGGTPAATGFGLVKKGLVMLCKTQQSLDHEGSFAKQANELGVPAEVLDAKGLAKLDPGVTMDVAGGVYFPKDCHLSPDRFMRALLLECKRLGVTFSWSNEVESASITRGRIEFVRSANPVYKLTEEQELDSVLGFPGAGADEFVLTAGSWSSSLAHQLGLKLPMQAGKGYSLTLTKPRELPQICAICTEARVAVTPMGNALRFGGTMEIAGLNETINPVRVQGIIKSVSKYYPKFTPDSFAGVQPWCGLRPCSPDGLPYVGRTAKFNNLSIATGHAMMGLSLGPITGKLMAEILSGAKPSIAIDALNPDRYA